MTRLLRPLSCCLLAVVLVAWSHGALAQEQTSSSAAAGALFEVRPIDGQDGDFFEAEIGPGASHTFTIVIANHGEDPLALRTYRAEAVSLVNGGFGLLEEQPAPGVPATWVDYPAETLEFGPSEGIERQFTVTVPEGTAPGQYVTGIAVQTAESLEVSGDGMFRQVIRKAAAISIIVPGPISAAAEIGLPGFTNQGGRAFLEIPIANVGNYRLRPQGTLSLRTPAGSGVLTAPITMRSVYAGHSTTISVAIPEQVLPGDYLVDLALTDVDTGWSFAATGRAATLVSATAITAPLQVTAASVTPMPDVAAPQFADIIVEITNTGSPVQAVRVTLVVAKDGELVEEFVLNQALAILEPVTVVQQRYIPATGFTPGKWTFALVITAVDPATGIEVEVATHDIPDPIVIVP